jgi:ribosomal protein L24E
MRAYEILLEYDRKREKQRIESLPTYQQRIKQDPDFSLEQLESADPTPQKSYVPRLAQWWLAGKPVEDLISTTADALAKYHQLKIKKQIKSQHADINKFKTADDFLSAVDQYQLTDDESEDRGKYREIYRDAELRVIELLDETAAKFWGQGTRWCTISERNNQFMHYFSSGPLYVIIPLPPQFVTYRNDDGESVKSQVKYQYWFRRSDPYLFQFMDVKDGTVDPLTLPFYDKLQPIMHKISPHIMWNTDPSDQLAAVKQNGDLLEFIKNPSEEIQIAALKNAPHAFKYIKNPSEEVQLIAVKHTGYAIQSIENPSEAVKLAAVQETGHAIQYIENPSEAVKLAAVQRDGLSIAHINNPSEKMQLIAVQNQPRAIQWIKKPSEQAQLIAVQENGDMIRYIENPSEQIQLIAVQNQPRAIQWFKNPSEQLQLIAVQKSPRAIQYIKKPSEQAQLVAVQKNGYAIEMIEDPSEPVQMYAVQENGYAIQYIDKPSEAVQLAAVKQDRNLINYIANPTPRVRQIAQRN